ncbi:hypothetical protein ABZS83_33035 [Streptomyces sp. NPDC005426]|uniref:hypothetical protein n=1 Tax=Streptomyces sp. NPDC005426 TaxID=3155344 RepID=UPI0033AF3384
MLSTTLPRHPRTGLLAVMLRKARPGEDPDQLYPVWPILGGDGTGDGGSARSADGGDGGDDGDGGDADAEDGTDDGDGQDDAEDGDGQDDADTKELGDKGRKALRELRRENRQLKAQLRTGARDAAKGQGKKGDDQGDDDPDAIRERAREEARAEVWGERVESAAIAAAAGRLANPQLAARLLDLSEIGENDKGRPDRDAISELIDELLEDEPYLAAPAKGDGRRFQGGADGGARKTPKKTAASLHEAVAARLAGKSG